MSDHTSNPETPQDESYIEQALLPEDVNRLIAEELEFQPGEPVPDWYGDTFLATQLLEGLGPRAQRVTHQHIYQYPGGSVDEDLPDSQFVFTVGDVLFSHLGFSGGMAGAGVTKLYNKFLHWRQPLGLEHIRVLCQYHHHSRALLSVAGGWYTLIEPGMGGRVQAEGYKVGYKLGTWQPSVQGFVRLEQYEGQDGQWHTDPASIELVAPRLVAQQAKGWRAA